MPSTCLCAPTTHEGSFRCRLHRTTLPNQAAAMAPSSDAAYLRVPQSPSIAGSQYRMSSSTCRRNHAQIALAPAGSTGCVIAGPVQVPNCNPNCYARPPAKRPPLYSPPSTPSSSSPNNAYISSHAAAMAIMRQHCHMKQKRNRIRAVHYMNSAPKIGPSRLNRMAMASADEPSITSKDMENLRIGSGTELHIAGSSTEFPSATIFLRLKHGTQAARSSSSTKLSQVNKYKQSESAFTCRLMGSRAGPLLIPLEGH